MILDSITIGSQRTRTRAGFLRAPAVIGRVGVLEYAPNDPAVVSAPPALKSAGRPIRMLRPESAVFDAESMQSFAGAPVLDEHSTPHVTPANYGAHLRGTIGSDIRRDGNDLVADLTIYDPRLIAEIESGKTGLSQGYDVVIDWTGGTDPIFGAFDGVYTKIIGNHLAVTRSARSGPDVRILDSNNKGSNMVKRTINGIEIEVPENITGVLDSYEKGAAESNAKIAELTGKIAAMEEAITDSKAEIARVTDSAYVEARVKDRAALVADAKRIAPAVVCDGLSEDAIRAAVVAARGVKVEGPDAIRGAFAALSSASDSPAATRVAGTVADGTAAKPSAEDLYNAARAKFAGNGR